MAAVEHFASELCVQVLHDTLPINSAQSMPGSVKVQGELPTAWHPEGEQ